MVITERHHAFLIPKKEIVSRLSKFQSQLNKTSISAAWIDHPVDLFYLSGSSQNGTLLIPADGPPILYVKKSLHRAEAESSIRVLPYPGRKGLIKKIKQLVGSNGQIGLAFDVTPVSTYTWLTDNLESIHIKDIGMQLRLQKAVKSEWEIAQIEKAADQAVKAFWEISDFIRPHITELELTGIIEGRLRAMGHAGTLRIRSMGTALPNITVVSGNTP